MRLTRKNATVLVTLAIAGTLGLSACSSNGGSNPSGFDAAAVKCSEVPAQINAAQAQLDKANATVKSDKGKPSEKDASTAAAKAQAKVNALSARLASPACTNAPGSSSASSSAPAVACTTWKMNTTTPRNGNWVTQGVTEIQKAKTNADAMKAAMAWLDKIKVYPGELNGASLYLLSKSVDTSSLVKDGCATQAAVDTVQVLRTHFELHPPKVAQAPANAVNTGTSNGTVVANQSAGISGNRKAIAVVGKNGKTVYIMARCGNAVAVGPPPVPNIPPPPARCTLKPKPGYYVTGECTFAKPPQSWQCMQNPHGVCPPNPNHQPVQVPGQPTVGVPGAPSEPQPLPTGPHNGQPPPSSAAPSGYNPGPSGAPGGGSNNGSSSSVRAPKPNPSPSQAVPTTDPVGTGTPPPPG